jgi:hypothetical protein
LYALLYHQVIKMLLQHYPEGARIPQGGSGLLPLVLAIKTAKRSWNDGIRTLMYAYPPALHNKKVIKPFLYPKLLALVTNANEVDEAEHDHRPAIRDRQARRVNHSRNTLYELLRTKPEWLTGEYGELE